MRKISRRDLLAGMAATPLLGARRPARGTSGAPRTPPPAEAAPHPNLIFMVCDTWSVHWLGCYGAQQVRTPNVDALAAKSALFLDAYPQALPTIPARRAIYTGRQVFPADLVASYDDPIIRGWHPLYIEDVTLSEALRDIGYRTGLVTDVCHQFKPGENFHRGFDAWRYIRGQESDRYRSGPRRGIDLAPFTHASQLGPDNGLLTQYLMNRQFWKSEEDWPASQVFREAAAWLDDNAAENQPFYLHVESYSPHEFWDPPEDYYRMYMRPAYSGPRLIWPPEDAGVLSAVEMAHVRALYAGMVTFVDAQVGRLFEKVNQLGLLENTVIVFTTDHGCMMGEQNQIHKGEGSMRTELTHVPLLVYYPGGSWAGRRVAGFVEHTDIMPTVLDLLNAPVCGRATGESLRANLESGEPVRRGRVVGGWGDHGTIRTPEWLYQGRWNEGEAYEELYDVRRDPLELVNVNQQNPKLIEEFQAQLREYVEAGWEVTRGGFSRLLETQA